MSDTTELYEDLFAGIDMVAQAAAKLRVAQVVDEEVKTNGAERSQPQRKAGFRSHYKSPNRGRKLSKAADIRRAKTVMKAMGIWRQAQGISQSSASVKINLTAPKGSMRISEGTYSHWEGGRHLPTEPHLATLEHFVKEKGIKVG